MWFGSNADFSSDNIFQKNILGFDKMLHGLNPDPIRIHPASRPFLK